MPVVSVDLDKVQGIDQQKAVLTAMVDDLLEPVRDAIHDIVDDESAFAEYYTQAIAEHLLTLIDDTDLTVPDQLTAALRKVLEG